MQAVYRFFSYRAGNRIKSFEVTENDILVIIKTLDPNNAHGCDNMYIYQNDENLWSVTYFTINNCFRTFS